MIEVIEGRGVGAGKSYLVLRDLMLHWCRGGTACVSDTVEIYWDKCKAYAEKVHRVKLQDDQYRSISSADLQRLHEVTPPGTDEMPVKIVVDEAQGAFNARDWSDRSKRPFFAWLCQSRHDDNDVVILSQAAANVDKQIRRLCTFVRIIRNTQKFPVFGTTLDKVIKFCTLGINDGRYFRITTLDQDGHTTLAKEWHRADVGLFKCYNSKAMRLAHRRAGDAVARKQLERVKGGSQVLKYALFFFIAAVAFCGYKVYAGHGSSAKSASYSGSKGYSIREATFLGTYDNRILCTVEFGNLETGEMSVLGMCEVIRGHRARIKSPAGGLIYVVATKELLPVTTAANQ
jgi:hypothetical protein